MSARISTVEEIIETYLPSTEEFNSTFLSELLISFDNNGQINPHQIFESCRQNVSEFSDKKANPFERRLSVLKSDFSKNDEFQKILIEFLRNVRTFLNNEELFKDLLNQSLDDITPGSGEVVESKQKIILLGKDEEVSAVGAPMKYIDHIKALEATRFQALKLIQPAVPIPSSSSIQSRYAEPIIDQPFNVPTPSPISFESDNAALVGCPASSSSSSTTKLPDVLFDVLDL